MAHIFSFATESTILSLFREYVQKRWILLCWELSAAELGYIWTGANLLKMLSAAGDVYEVNRFAG